MMLKRMQDRARTGAIVVALVAPLSWCVVAFLGLACYFALRDTLPPEQAALVTAAGGIVLIALVLLFARLGSGGGAQRSARRGSAPRELGDGLETLLREQIDPAMRDWIREHPNKAALTTLLIGVAAGYSDQTRRLLVDAYTRLQEADAQRRER